VNPRPKISLVYIFVVAAVYFYVHKNYGNDLQQLILTLAVIDIIIGIFTVYPIVSTEKRDNLMCKDC